MNRRLFLTIPLALAVAPALAQDTAAVKKAIQARYNKEATAFAERDAATILAINTTDFSALDEKGTKRTRKDLEENLTRILAAATSCQLKTTVEKVVVKGNTAVATVSDTSKIVVLNPQTKKKMTIDGTTRNEDTWVKKNGVWLRKANKTLQSKTLVDGKPSGG